MTKLVTWVVDGPANGGTLSWAAGMLLWWRTWATCFLLTTPVAVGLIVLSYSSGYWAVLATVLAHGVTLEPMLSVNPKWEVTKNY